MTIPAQPQISQHLSPVPSQHLTSSTFSYTLTGTLLSTPRQIHPCLSSLFLAQNPAGCPLTQFVLPHAFYAHLSLSSHLLLRAPPVQNQSHARRIVVRVSEAGPTIPPPLPSSHVHSLNKPPAPSHGHSASPFPPDMWYPSHRLLELITSPQLNIPEKKGAWHGKHGDWVIPATRVLFLATRRLPEHAKPHDFAAI